MAGPGPAFLHELEGGGFGDVLGEGAAEVEAGFIDADDEDVGVGGGAGAVEVDLVLDPPGSFLGEGFGGGEVFVLALGQQEQEQNR